MAPGAHAAGRKKPGHFGRGDRIFVAWQDAGVGWRMEKRKEKREKRRGKVAPRRRREAFAKSGN